MIVRDVGDYLAVTLEPGDALECKTCEDTAVCWWASHRNLALSKAAAAKGNHFHLGSTVLP